MLQLFENMSNQRYNESTREALASAPIRLRERYRMQARRPSRLIGSRYEVLCPAGNVLSARCAGVRCLARKHCRRGLQLSLLSLPSASRTTRWGVFQTAADIYWLRPTGSSGYLACWL